MSVPSPTPGSTQTADERLSVVATSSTESALKSASATDVVASPTG
jgi:hypothetical protein